jgi:hypothetical protein
VSTPATRWLAALLVGFPLALAGCSSSTNGTGSALTTPPLTTPAQSSAPPASSAPAPTTSAPETVTEAEAKAALLTLKDVGSGFTAAQFQPSTDPLPCTPNDPPLEQQVPSTLEVGTAFLRNGAAFGEDLRFYPDADTAEHVLAVAADGLDCTSGRLRLTGQPETVTFGSIQDVSSAVSADRAIAVQGQTAKLDAVLVACRLGRVAVLFSFLRAKSTPTSQLPNPISIVSTALQKIKNS